jgi:hypothetical protein
MLSLDDQRVRQRQVAVQKDLGSCNQSVHLLVKVDNDFSYNRATR